MPSTKSIIQLGLQLLKNGRLDANELGSYSDAFSILKVDVSKPLKLAALKSVFSTPDETAQYYEPSALNPEHINYPCNSMPMGDIQGFGEAEMSGSNELTMLEKYGTFVSVVTTTDAVDSAVHTQTPVYDLFKTAAAIYDCLKTGEGTEEFLLVGCDFSGIQDTVYTITSKGALKTLRARSFMLELLTEHIITEILEAVGSDRYTIIYSGGGGFCLLLPNSMTTIEKIMKYRRSINDWALDEFVGRLFIAIDVLPFAIQKLAEEGGFQELRQTQFDNLDRLKRTKFLDQLAQLFDPKMPEQVTVRTECQITRRDDLEAGKMRNLETGKVMDTITSLKEREDDKWTWVSESCYRQFHIGDQLIDAEAKKTCVLRTARHLDDKAYFKFPDINWTEKSRTENKDYAYYYIVKTESTEQDVWRINDWSGQRTLLFANYVRKCGDLSPYAQNKELELANEEREKKISFEDIQTNTASFTGLAASSTGADLIGALRMDVDDMGDMFSRIENLPELSTKSRMLNLFFKVYLNEICRGKLGEGVGVMDIVGKNYTQNNGHGGIGRNVSVIYAGGDDLFIAGAWDETTEIAFDIQQAFALFTQGNRSISGGLTLHQPKFPLYQMAKRSAESEKFAKHDTDNPDGLQKKKRIALFYDEEKKLRQKCVPSQTNNRYMLSMTWSLGRDYLIPLMMIYRQCGRSTGEDNERKIFEMNKNTISYQSIEKWFQVLATYRSKGRLYLPVMARVLKDVENAFSINERGIFEQLFRYLYTEPYTEELYLANLHIALNWLSYLGRNK